MAEPQTRPKKLPPIKKRVPLVMAKLWEMYPESRIALNFDSPFQLLVATILSAQCTDIRVNKETPKLFDRFPDAATMAESTVEELLPFVRSINFFNNKAVNIIAAAQMIVEKHGGEVPRTMEELTELPGIGRKSANVILGDAYGIPGITVDTHLGRLTRRLGFTTETDPVKVETAVCKLVPQADWTEFSHRIIDHGRAVCDARKPNCAGCGLLELCPQVGVELQPKKSQKANPNSPQTAKLSAAVSVPKPRKRPPRQAN